MRRAFWGSSEAAAWKVSDRFRNLLIEKFLHFTLGFWAKVDLKLPNAWGWTALLLNLGLKSYAGILLEWLRGIAQTLSLHSGAWV